MHFIGIPPGAITMVEVFLLHRLQAVRYMGKISFLFKINPVFLGDQYLAHCFSPCRWLFAKTSECLQKYTTTKKWICQNRHCFNQKVRDTLRSTRVLPVPVLYVSDTVYGLCLTIFDRNRMRNLQNAGTTYCRHQEV